MADKKISELSLLSTIIGDVYSEVQDTNESDPTLQNKKIAAHIQNTDQYLDFGGANQVSAAELANPVIFPPAVQYLLASSIGVGEGDIFLTSYTGTGVLYIGKVDNAGINQGDMIGTLSSGDFIYMSGSQNSLVAIQLISDSTDNGDNLSWTITIRGTYGTFDPADKIVLTVIKG